MDTRPFLAPTQEIAPTALEELTALVARATLAPSPHNTQPWRWVVHPDCAEIELAEDASRALPANDPGSRELVMSCGAALMTLRVAAAQALLQARVEIVPDPERPLLLARVRLEPGAVDAEFAGLDAAVGSRRTVWHRFTNRPLPDGLPERLATETLVEGAHLTFLDIPTRARISGLVRAAEVEKARDPAGLREVLHLPSPRAAITDATRRWRVGASLRLLASAPAVAVLWTDDESHAAWLAGGEALQRALLVAAQRGVLAGFVNAACQVPATRSELARVIAGVEGIQAPRGEALAVHPQAVLRLGFPLHRPPRTPRRPVGDVMVVDRTPSVQPSDALDEDWADDELG